MPFDNDQIELVRISHGLYELKHDLVYVGESDTFTVKAGSRTDYATVPQFVSWLIPSDGDYTLAAILHDEFCNRLNDWDRVGGKSKPNYVLGITREEDGKFIPRPTPNARDTDAIFRRIMRESKVPFLRRWIIWTGVRWGAAGNPARWEGWWRDLPKVLILSLIALPVVPIALAAWMLLIVDNVVNKALSLFGVE